MSKIEKEIRNYINDNLKHNDQFDIIASKANLEKNHKKERVSFMKNKWLKIFVPCVLAIALVLTLVLVIGNNNSQDKKPSEPAAVIQMDVNPSISLVVDENKIVLSCYGENDEGKMIILDEEIVGLALDKAIEKIIEIETKTGYLVKDAANKISYIVESDKEELLTELETAVKTKTEEVCDKLNIEENIEIAKAKGHEELVKRAIAIDPTLDESVAKEMTSKELVKYIMGCQLEKATIPTVEIENFYNTVKENRISFAEKEETKKLVDTLDATYQNIKDNYGKLLTSLKEASDSLNTLYYKEFISDESNYKKAVESIKTAKAELLKLRNEVTELPEGSIEKAIKEAEIIAKENAIKGLELTLEGAKNAADLLLKTAQTTLNNIIEQMESSYDELPSEVKTELNKNISEYENKINEVKDNSFKYFEENYKTDIEKALAKVSEYKASLVEQLK